MKDRSGSHTGFQTGGAPATRNRVSTANLAGHPLHPILITLPIGLFVATFLFDLLFWWRGTEAFATGAFWLLGAGLVGAALAAVTGLIDFLATTAFATSATRGSTR